MRPFMAFSSLIEGLQISTLGTRALSWSCSIQVPPLFRVQLASVWRHELPMLSAVRIKSASEMPKRFRTDFTCFASARSSVVRIGRDGFSRNIAGLLTWLSAGRPCLFHGCALGDSAPSLILVGSQNDCLGLPPDMPQRDLARSLTSRLRERILSAMGAFVSDECPILLVSALLLPNPSLLRWAE
ncbi:hypothetical protein ACVWZ4_007427 [Bradyrhizobium sp. USDA 4472]